MSQVLNKEPGNLEGKTLFPFRTKEGTGIVSKINNITETDGIDPQLENVQDRNVQ